MFFHYHASKKDANKWNLNNTVFYALCFLYVLSTATLALDLTISLTPQVSKNNQVIYI